VVRERKGDLDGALAAYRQAVQLNPQYATSHSNIGSVLIKKGDLDGAVSALREAIRLASDYAGSYVNLAIALEKKGDLSGAVASYKDYVRLVPNNPTGLNNLAWLYAAGPDWLRDGKRAVDLATRACELTGWKNAGDIDTLAAAYAEVGEFEKAVAYQERALALSNSDEQVRAELSKHKSLYERKQPCREPTLDRRELAPPPRAAMETIK
jgi:Flp pilus assembly protein TadD